MQCAQVAIIPLHLVRLCAARAMQVATAQERQPNAQDLVLLVLIPVRALQFALYVQLEPMALLKDSHLAQFALPECLAIKLDKRLKPMLALEGLHVLLANMQDPVQLLLIPPVLLSVQIAQRANTVQRLGSWLTLAQVH